jgi:hypothetical protein
MRKKISALLTLSAAIALLLSSPMLFFNVLQPAQAQTPMTFRTTQPANGTNFDETLTFDAHGTASSSDPQSAKITNGTFKLTPKDGSPATSGPIQSGDFTNDSHGGSILMSAVAERTSLGIQSSCSMSNNNQITVFDSNGDVGLFSGPVECSSSKAGDTSTPSSSPTTTGTTTQDRDSDSDGIPDSSDKCTHNSYHRCFKEGDTNTTTTHQQQPSSSIGGNQTRQ